VKLLEVGDRNMRAVLERLKVGDKCFLHNCKEKYSWEEKISLSFNFLSHLLLNDISQHFLFFVNITCANI